MITLSALKTMPLLVNHGHDLVSPRSPPKTPWFHYVSEIFAICNNIYYHIPYCSCTTNQCSNKVIQQTARFISYKSLQWLSRELSHLLSLRHNSQLIKQNRPLFTGCLGGGGGLVGYSACLQAHKCCKCCKFEFCCCPLTTGPLCHRCAPTCLQTESKLAP